MRLWTFETKVYFETSGLLLNNTCSAPPITKRFENCLFRDLSDWTICWFLDFPATWISKIHIQLFSAKKISTLGCHTIKRKMLPSPEIEGKYWLIWETFSHSPLAIWLKAICVGLIFIRFSCKVTFGRSKPTEDVTYVLFCQHSNFWNRNLLGTKLLRFAD